MASHVFDHRDHLRHGDRRWPWAAHLALPEPLYRAWAGHPLGFHNRLSPEEILEMCASVGFDLIGVRRLTLPTGRYATSEAEAMAGSPGCPRWLLARRFRGWSELDRRTAAAHCLLRRPLKGAVAT